MTGRVVVIGAGVAGTAAAFAAHAQGAEVVMISHAPGGSALMSGAVDDREPAEASALLEPHLRAFIDAIGLWSIDETAARVATCSGTLRAARGRDRAILNLEAMRDARIAVPNLRVSGWEMELLAKAWSSDPWAEARGIAFVAVDVEALEDAELSFPDPDLAGCFDEEPRLRRFCDAIGPVTRQADAILLGPWLGLSVDTCARAERLLGKPVGECLSPVGSSAGVRFGLAATRVIAGATSQWLRAKVRALVVEADRVLVQHDASDEPIVGDCAVVACGGLTGGGIEMHTPEADHAGEMPAGVYEPFRLSMSSVMQLHLGGVVLETAGSMQGPNLERMAWPSTSGARSWLERVSIRHREGSALDREGKLVERLLVAGDVAVDGPATVLGSAISGTSAGVRASVRSERP